MPSNWQKDFFRDIALDCWRQVFSPEQTCAEVDFLQRVLQPPAGGKLLDICCGNGRHAVEFVGRGFRLTGVDQSEEFIAEARQSRPAASACWILGDMCELPWTAEFDGGYCFGNSFGYLDHAGVRTFLDAVARALKPGARFVIDTGVAAESILPTLVRNRWFRVGEMLMLSENQYDAAASRLDIQYTFVRNGKAETRPTASYVFTVAELLRLHEEAGLKKVGLLSSLTGEPYQLGSPRLLLISANEPVKQKKSGPGGPLS